MSISMKSQGNSCWSGCAYSVPVYVRASSATHRSASRYSRTYSPGYAGSSGCEPGSRKFLTRRSAGLKARAWAS